MSGPFALMLRSVAASSLRRVSKHEGVRAISRPGPTSSFETRARKARRRRAWTRFCCVRAPQDEVGTKAVPCVADEVIE
jgi:hypothetical protein